MVFELAARLIERVTNGNVDIFVRVMFGRGAIDDNFRAGHRSQNGDVIEVAAMLSASRKAHRDATAHDAGKEAIKRIGAFANLGLNRR